MFVGVSCQTMIPVYIWNSSLAQELSMCIKARNPSIFKYWWKPAMHFHKWTLGCTPMEVVEHLSGASAWAHHRRILMNLGKLPWCSHPVESSSTTKTPLFFSEQKLVGWHDSALFKQQLRFPYFGHNHSGGFDVCSSSCHFVFRCQVVTLQIFEREKNPRSFAWHSKRSLRDVKTFQHILQMTGITTMTISNLNYEPCVMD